MAKKVVLFELNEVPWRVVDAFCARHPTSPLARLLPRCRQFETWTEDSNLSPWTTWPTFHRGVSDQRHTIHHFGQDLREIDREFPPVWQIIQAHGLRTGVGGSLHSYPPPPDFEGYAFYLPDTFATGRECFPRGLERFQAFNLAMARDSARVIGDKVHWKPALRMLAVARGLGLRTATLTDVMSQLVSERRHPWKRVRRRTYQVVLAFDVFMKALRETQPDFCTFFTNHVASSMHRYWAATFPEDYANPHFDQSWMATYGSEIDFTMAKFDGFLKRLVEFVDRSGNYVLWIGTSMGQAATVAREVETKLLLTQVDRFMRRLAFTAGEWTQKPAMAPQTNFVMASPEVAQRFRLRLEGLRVGGEAVRYEEREGGFFSVTIGHENIHERPLAAALAGQDVSYHELGLEITKIDDKCGATAYHVPQGTLVIYDPTNRERSGARREVIPTTALAPHLLRHFGLGVPSYMSGVHESALDSPS